METYVQRRKVLSSKIDGGLILLLGNQESPMNYTDNTYRFRQDSNFLYYFGLDIAGLAGIIDIDSGEEIIFGNDLTIDDIVWTGPQPSISDMSIQVGVTKSKPLGALEDIIQRASNSKREIHIIPPYRHDNIIRLSQWLGTNIASIKDLVSIPLIKAIVSQRSIKEPIEILELHKAAIITSEMHLAAMKSAKSGMKEYEIVSNVHREALKAGGDISFPIILTVNGETLHNHYHGNTLKEGQMILCDAGAETDMHYAGDMTCTFPVSKHFTSVQKEIYQIVLDTHENAVTMLKPGVMYKDVYIRASEHIFAGLKSLGLTKGDPSEAVSLGAHALFFQCGLGHMLGLDVHDMEDLGEHFVGYGDDMHKSTQFGLKSLRLARELKQGFALTVEPGIYFIPTLIDRWRYEGRFSDFINYDKVVQFKDFGGIRVEEDFIITENGCQQLGKPLPKSIKAIEEIRQSILE